MRHMWTAIYALEYYIHVSYAPDSAAIPKKTPYIS